MSLLATASIWNEDVNKKRQPTMRKTQKKMPVLNDKSETLEKDIDISSDETRPNSFEEDQTKSNERNDRISRLIDNMSSVLEENDGSNLENFTPLDPPELHKLHDQEHSPYGRNGDEEIPSLPNQIQLQPPKIRQETNNFGPSQQDLGVSNNPSQTNPYSNYRRIYEPSQLRVPDNYYSKMGSDSQPIMDNKLLEKINYMIYMLEQQQNEKTSNIMEEFILYLFLGVFIIFIVDAFSRTGKYIR
jgi:hypothetical protein